MEIILAPRHFLWEEQTLKGTGELCLDRRRVLFASVTDIFFLSKMYCVLRWQMYRHLKQWMFWFKHVKRNSTCTWDKTDKSIKDCCTHRLACKQNETMHFILIMKEATKKLVFFWLSSFNISTHSDRGTIKQDCLDKKADSHSKKRTHTSVSSVCKQRNQSLVQTSYCRDKLFLKAQSHMRWRKHD